MMNDKIKIQDYGITQILVTGPSAIAMVVGTEHIQNADESFTRVSQFSDTERL